MGATVKANPALVRLIEELRTLSRGPLEHVHADELDLHRAQAEVVHVLDPIPEGAALARKGDA